MNKNEFLNELQKSLEGLPQEEINNAMNYYEEYLEDAGEENAEKIIADLDKPSAIAAQIRADAAIKALKKEPNSPKKGISAAWLVLLAILASPIALPVALAIILLFFALLITIGAFLFSLAVVSVCLIVAGIATGVFTIPLAFGNPAAALAGVGAGFVCIGLGILFGILTILFFRWGFRAMAFLLNKLTTRKGGVSK